MTSDHVHTASIHGATVTYQLGHKMVVCSPGIGVHAGSPGWTLLTDIVASLPPTVGYALFSYSEVVDSMVRVKTIAEDAALLKTIVAWVQNQSGVDGVAIVGHSRGCIDASAAAIHPLSSVILLAPPLRSGDSRQYFTKKAGAIRKGDDWFVPRSDGTTSIMPDRIFQEYESLALEELIAQYAAMQPLQVIAAGDDRILGTQDFSKLQVIPTISIETIPNASHDFNDEARQTLIEYVNSQLKRAFVLP